MYGTIEFPDGRNCTKSAPPSRLRAITSSCPTSVDLTFDDDQDVLVVVFGQAKNQVAGEQVSPVHGEPLDWHRLLSCLSQGSAMLGHRKHRDDTGLVVDA